MRGGTRSPGALLASPVFIGSIGLLLLNDHVLKHAWPGLVTGKLSDVAGVAMVAIALTALVRRAAVAFALTAVAFMALKTVPAVAIAAAPVLGGVTRTDPTDLIALAVLVPLWVWAHGQPHPIDGSRWMLPLRVAAVGAAVFATTATSCGDDGITQIVAADGALFAADASHVYRSDDGRRWERIGDIEPEMSGAGGLLAPERRSPDLDCFDGRCFRVERVDGVTRVVAERGGEVDVLLVLTDAEAAEIEAVVDEVGGVGCGIVGLSDLAVVAAPDGLRISVAAGAAGILHRAPDGQWAWTAAGRWGMPASVAEAPPLDLPLLAFADDPTDWGVWVAALLPLAVLAVFVGLGALVVRLAQRNGRSGRRVWAAIGGFGTVYLIVALLAFVATLDEGLFALAAVSFALLGGAVLGVVLIALAARNGRRAPGSALPPPQPRQRVG